MGTADAGRVAFLALLDNATAAGGVTLDEFRAYLPAHTYIFMPRREPWPAASVNARIRDWPTVTTKTGEQKAVPPAAWLDRHRAVEQMTWCPGRPEVIADRLIADGGFIDRAGCSMVNLYRPPRVASGNPRGIGPWLDHLRRIYPDDAEHLIAWFAHRVQKPAEKLNHAIVLGWAQGIGKDSLLEPLKYAVGPWNFAEILPEQLLVGSTASSAASCCASMKRRTRARSTGSRSTNG